MTVSFYTQNAQALFKQYHSTTFERAHASWKAFWPLKGDKVLDVGAGSGRDSKWMQDNGCDVIALEPACELLKLGKAYTGEGVSWLNDKLPALDKTYNLGLRFDLILVSAVWMHIPPSSRERAFRKLANLLAPNGKLIISLRHGNFDDGRQSYPVSLEELTQLAKNSALSLRESKGSKDSLNRDEVHWQTVVMSLPNDGTGDLNAIRHIIVNDNKVATYKLALLRTLLRIADAHSGAVIDRHDGKVAIPLGLVGLYWIKQFKRLIDKEDLQQNSNSDKGLGFIKPNGWNKLVHLSPDDLTIGSCFFGDDAISLQVALKDALATIKSGPVTFTYLGDKSNPYFQIERKKRLNKERFVIDIEFLSDFGNFVLDESLWDCLRLYHSWIEPLVVNQWINEMRRFKRNQERGISLQTYYDCLVWIDKKHDTSDVRKRIIDLQKERTIESVWSGKVLHDAYHVDHALPFAYWPNNDKWNLLPATIKENLTKKDRAPTMQRLQSSKDRILNWWQHAWSDSAELEERFFTEAVLSLPNVPPKCREYEAVFESMGLQLRGVTDRLLIQQW